MAPWEETAKTTNMVVVVMVVVGLTVIGVILLGRVVGDVSSRWGVLLLDHCRHVDLIHELFHEVTAITKRYYHYLYLSGIRNSMISFEYIKLMHTWN